MSKEDIKWLASIAFSATMMYLLCVASIVCFG